jgi:hypothetical protein
MNPFTPLDVIRYEQTPKSLVVSWVIKKVLLNTHSVKMKQQVLYVANLLQNGLNKTSRTPINIPFKVAVGRWEDYEWQWYLSMIDVNLVASCCFGHTLRNARELLYVFVEMLRIKFWFDANLMCVLDDLLKRLEI